MKTAVYHTLINLPFIKMNGIGNDFVILDRRSIHFDIESGAARCIANRISGIGCDQIIILETSTKADVFMRIINADGSEVGACGNATRCVGWLIMQELGRDTASIETSSGILKAFDGGSLEYVCVDMGRPLFGAKDIPLAIDTPDTKAVPLDVASLNSNLPAQFSTVNMGNPHAVFFVDDVNAHDFSRVGPILEYHPIFPERANISLVSVKSRTHLVQRVWERGAGLTIACGTGACAAAICAIRAGFTDRKVTVTLPGGNLDIEWLTDGHVMMSGKIQLDFKGHIDERIFFDAPQIVKLV